MRIISTSYFLTVILSIVHVEFVHSEDEYTLDILRIDLSSSSPSEHEDIATIKKVVDGEEKHYREVLSTFVTRVESTGVWGFNSDYKFLDLPNDATKASYFALHWSAKPSSTNLRSKLANTANSAKVGYESSALYQILIALKGFPSAVPIVSEDFEYKFFGDIKRSYDGLKLFEDENQGHTLDVNRLKSLHKGRYIRDVLQMHDSYRLITHTISVLLPTVEFVLVTIEINSDLIIECNKVTKSGFEAIDTNKVLSKDEHRFVILVYKARKSRKNQRDWYIFKEYNDRFWREHSDEWFTMTMVSPGSNFQKQKDSKDVEFLFDDIKQTLGFYSIQLTDELKWPSTDGHPKDTKATKSRISKLMSRFFGSREAT